MHLPLLGVLGLLCACTAPVGWLGTLSGTLQLPEDSQALSMEIDNPNKVTLSLSMQWTIAAQPEGEDPFTLSLSQADTTLNTASGQEFFALSVLEGTTCSAHSQCTSQYELTALGEEDASVMWEAEVWVSWVGLQEEAHTIPPEISFRVETSQ